MTSLKAAELKFLLKLLGRDGYKGKISKLSPSSKTSAADRNRICEALSAKGLVDYMSEVARFSIAPPGTTLLGLDPTNLPVTSDELAALKACKGSMTPGKLGSKIPASSRQQIISSLADRGLLKVTKSDIKEAWLTAQGKQFLRDEYEPTGNYAPGTANMMANYVRFLRATLGQMTNGGTLPTGEPPSQPHSSMPSEGHTVSNIETVFQQIQQLDRFLDTDNYLPIYHLREKLQPPLTRAELDSHLYALQRGDRIELSSLHDQGDYSDAQVSAGIRQENQGYLFFISIV